MILDDITKEYYITMDDIREHSTIQEDDIAQEWQGIDNIDVLLKELSQDVYIEMYDAVRVGDKQHHAKAIRYMIDYDERKQYYLMRAIIEYIRENIRTGERELPHKAKTILSQGGLYVSGQIRIPEETLKEW